MQICEICFEMWSKTDTTLPTTNIQTAVFQDIHFWASATFILQDNVTERDMGSLFNSLVCSSVDCRLQDITQDSHGL